MSDLDYEVIKIRSISHYLNILTKLYPNTNENSERFYRGLSSEKYVNVDCPSIYRSKKETIKIKRKDVTIEYDPYIKYEDKIFHDIIAKAPDEFNKCENTFERLVKMQHYGTPTRLLDVTSNPLIALYFACLNGDGSVSSDSDGAIAIYDIPQSNIKNFNSDTVTILSNLARIDEKYTPLYVLYNQYIKEGKSEILNDEYLTKNNWNIDRFYSAIEMFIKLKSCVGFEKNLYIKMIKLILHTKKYFINKEIVEEYINLSFPCGYPQEQIKPKYTNEKRNKVFSKIRKNFEDDTVSLKSIIDTLPNNINLKFKHLIQEDKPYFVYENIIPKDLESVFCVKPKLSNPRITNQNGAFLIFGFADLTDNKLTIPTQHFSYKPLNNDSSKHLYIKIPKNQKKKLLNELKLFGIDRAFIYPEIENISKVITEKYTIKCS